MKSDSSECIRHASVTLRNTEYAKYDPPGEQVSDDALAQKYLLYTPPARLKRKIQVPTGVFLQEHVGFVLRYSIEYKKHWVMSK